VPYPFIIVRLTGDRPPVRQFEIALRTLQRLDRWLFIDGENDRVFGRRHIEPNDFGSFGDKIGVVALAPGLATGKINFVSPQKSPDILLMHVTKCIGEQRSRPIGKARRRLGVEQRQDPLARLGSVFRLGAAVPGLASSDDAAGERHAALDQEAHSRLRSPQRVPIPASIHGVAADFDHRGWYG